MLKQHDCSIFVYDFEIFCRLDIGIFQDVIHLKVAESILGKKILVTKRFSFIVCLSYHNRLANKKHVALSMFFTGQWQRISFPRSSGIRSTVAMIEQVPGENRKKQKTLAILFTLGRYENHGQEYLWEGII